MRAKVRVKALDLRAITLQVVCHLSLFAIGLMAILFMATGCSKRYSDLPAFLPVPFKDYPNESVGRFKSSFIVDQIDSYYRGTNPGPIGVTTFVNLDDLYTTSTFGRMFSEQVISELAMRGFDVVEMRHSDALQFLSTEGEFALSRDITSVRRERDLGALIVGTYVASPERVYVNTRLIDPSTSLVLSAGSVEFSKTQEIARLLRGGSLPASLERIPVKHLGSSTYPMMLFPRSLQYQAEESGAGAGDAGRADSFRFNPSPRLDDSPVELAPKGAKKPGVK